MIGGMDMNQILAGLGSEPGQFGMGGYNSPSGMHSNYLGGGGQQGPSQWGQALGSLGKAFSNMAHRGQGQEGEPEMPQQQQQPDIQGILQQLFQERANEGGQFGGRFANYLGGPNGLR